MDIPNFSQSGTNNNNIGINLGTVNINQNSISLSNEQIIESFNQASEDLNTHKSSFGKEPKAIIERTQVEAIESWIKSDLQLNEQPLAVVAGNAGYGKSVVMKQLLNLLQNNNVPILAIKSDKLIINSISELNVELGFKFQIEELILKIKESTERVVVIIDQIDALSLSLSSNRKPLNTYNRLISRLSNLGDNVRIIISCRIFDLEYDPYLQQYNNLKKFLIEKLEIKEVERMLVLQSINPSIFSEKFKEFLRIPLHLEIFSIIHYKSIVSEFTSLQDLYAEYWRQKIINTPTDLKVIDFVKTLSKEMFNKQQITVDKRLFENSYDKEIGYLISGGVITSIEYKIQFVHQSFFDYTNARSFVEDNRVFSDEILQNNYHQGLFIRSGLRHILIYLRDVKPSDYIKEIETLILSKHLRFHIKLLLLNTIGYFETPLKSEEQLIESLMNNDEFLFKLFIESANSEKWIKYLLIKAHVVKKLETDFPNYSSTVFHLLRKALNVDSILAMKIVLKLPEFNEKPNFIRRLLFSAEDFSNEKILDLFDAYFDNSIDSHGYFRFIQKTIPYYPDWAIQKLKKFYIETGTNDLGRPFSNLHEEAETYKILLKKHPQKAIDYFIQIVLEINESNTHAMLRAGLREYFSGPQFMFYVPKKDHIGSNELLFYICDSILDYLTDNFTIHKNNVLRIVDKLQTTKSLTLHSLTFPCIIQFKGDFKIDVYNYLIQRPSLFTEYSVFQLYEFYFRKLIEQFFPVWNTSQKEQITQLILNAVSIDEKKKGFFYKTGSTDKGQNWYGITKYKLLIMIPKSERALDSRLKREYQELHRKFGDISNNKPQGFTITSGETLMSQNAYEYMTLNDWINSFVKYQGDNSPPWDRKVSELGHSRKFEKLCTENPDKFWPILKAAIKAKKVPITYPVYGLQGFSKSEYNVNKTAQLFNLLVSERIDELKDFPLQILIWSTDVFIEKKANIREVIVFLCGIIKNTPDKEHVNNDLLTEGINSIRGAAVDRLIQCYKFKEFGNLIFETIESIADKANIVTRASAITNMALLNNLNKERNLELFLKLNHDFNADLLAIPLHDLHPLVYLIHVDFGKLIPFFEKAIEEEKSHKPISHILFFAWLNNYSGSEGLLNKLLTLSSIAKKTVINVAFHNINDEKSFDKCYEIILRFLNEDDKQIVDEYTHSFVHLEPGIFQKIQEYLFKYTDSKAGESREYSFYNYLQKCILEYQEKDIAEKCIDLTLKFNNHVKPDIAERALLNEPLKVVIDSYSVIRDYGFQTEHLELAMDAFDNILKIPEYRGNMKDMLNKLDESIFL